jgi:hypothetical protein
MKQMQYHRKNKRELNLIIPSSLAVTERSIYKK